MGGILDQHEEDGLTDDTIVVFWSDHGVGMPRGKRWANDSGLHEPLIIRRPGHLSAATSTEALVHLMDLAPSMLLDGAYTPDSPVFEGLSSFGLCRWLRDQLFWACRWPL
ncbi:sulfatase-like hydrolase/transferase [Saccharopolyspora sp. NPDC003752]